MFLLVKQVSKSNSQLGTNPRTKPQTLYMLTATTRDSRESPGHPHPPGPNHSLLMRKSKKSRLVLQPTPGSVCSDDSCYLTLLWVVTASLVPLQE